MQNKSFSYQCIKYFLALSTVLLSYSECVTFVEDTTLSRNQKELLQNFKSSVSDSLPHDYMKQDIFLLKWLRSSRFDMDLAKMRLLKDIEWRKEQNLDRIHTENYTDLMQDGFRFSIDGRDRAGKPIIFFDAGAFDPRKAIISGKSDRLERYTYQSIEAGCQLVRKLGEKYGNVTRAVVLTNFDGFHPITHSCLRCIPVLTRLLVAFFDHWPECVDQLTVVNAPESLLPLVEILRPIVTDVSGIKIKIFGKNKIRWTEALSKEIDFNQLPVSLGGLKMDLEDLEDSKL